MGRLSGRGVCIAQSYSHMMPLRSLMRSHQPHSLTVGRLVGGCSSGGVIRSHSLKAFRDYNALQRFPVRSTTTSTAASKLPPSPNDNNNSPTTSANEPSEMQIFRHVLKYLWPRDDLNTKLRVCGALSLLLGGKVYGYEYTYIYAVMINYMYTCYSRRY
jgi:hypothetical protein